MKILSTQTRTLVTIFCLACCLSAKAQFVTIPDTAFVRWLTINGYSQCMNGNQLDTTCPAVTNTVSLNLSPSFATGRVTEIISIEGVQYFDALDSLECRYLKLQSIAALPPGLAYLNCANNSRLKNLGGLPSGLKNLICYEDSLVSLPSLPDSLTFINCTKNKLTSLPVLPANLSTIICNENTITNLPTLPETLLVLSCDDNAITNLPALPDSLRVLRCYSNQITSLPLLPQSLKGLYCGINQLTSIPPLPNGLTDFDCNYNVILTLPPLPDSLRVLMTDNTPMTTLPSLPGNLRELFCYNSLLTSLPALPPTLKILICDSNQLYFLPELPDSMWSVSCTKNPNLHCLPELKTINWLVFDSVNINCLTSYGNIGNSSPSVYSKPLCDSVTTCSAINSTSSIVGPQLTMHLSPNPASDYVTITIDEPLLNSTATLTDITGRRLMVVQLTTHQQSLITSNLSNGVYFVTITNSNGKSATKKLVVSK